MNAPNRPLRNERLEVVNRQDSQALFDPVTGSLHTLDPTSMAIWEACDGASLRELSSAGLLSSG